MSLLTQFYPGPGGGGGGSPMNVSGSLPSYVVYGLSGTATSGAWSALAPGNVYFPDNTSNGNPIVDTGAGSWTGTMEKIQLNNTRIDFSIPTNLGISEVILNNSYLRINPNVSYAQLATISGTGGMNLPFANPNNLPALSTIETGVAIFARGSGTFAITNSSLSAATVNHILESMVETGSAALLPAFCGTVDLSGGTSAGTSALTTAGLAARNALVAAGWAVTLNL